jgi:hypothetical protein
MNLIRELVTIAPDCECIKVTYTLVGEEPVTVEVESTGIQNSRPSWIPFIVDGISYNIFWVTGVWRLNGGSPSINQARLITDNNCPFGTYTILEGSDFESFIVEPCY